MTANDLASNRLILIAAALILGVAASAAIQPAHAQTVDEAVVAVEKHYQAIADLGAKVTQKNHLKSVGKTQTFEGVLLIKKPGRLRLEYTNGQIILVNGKEALIYMKKSGQMIKKTFTDFEHMNIPVAFLLGAAHIRDDFDTLQPDPKAPRALELIPKKSGAAMKKLGLVSDDTGRITAMTIFDRSGNVTEISFTDAHEGVGLDDKLFTFTPPKGTEIIEQ
jgi:outer membrane lipoprotein carrier protein